MEIAFDEHIAVDGEFLAVGTAADGYAETVHRYEKPGHYLVRVERAGQGGAKSVARLHVRVGEGPDE